MPRDTEKSPLSALAGVRIWQVNFRNCPYIRVSGCFVIQKLTFYLCPVIGSASNERLFTFTFVIVKKKKKVESRTRLSEDAHKLKRKYELYS